LPILLEESAKMVLDDGVSLKVSADYGQIAIMVVFGDYTFQIYVKGIIKK